MYDWIKNKCSCFQTQVLASLCHTEGKRRRRDLWVQMILTQAPMTEVRLPRVLRTPELTPTRIKRQRLPSPCHQDPGARRSQAGISARISGSRCGSSRGRPTSTSGSTTWTRRRWRRSRARRASHSIANSTRSWRWKFFVFSYSSFLIIIVLVNHRWNWPRASLKPGPVFQSICEPSSENLMW